MANIYFHNTEESHAAASIPRYTFGASTTILGGTPFFRRASFSAAAMVPPPAPASEASSSSRGRFFRPDGAPLERFFVDLLPPRLLPLPLPLPLDACESEDDGAFRLRAPDAERPPPRPPRERFAALPRPGNMRWRARFWYSREGLSQPSKPSRCTSMKPDNKHIFSQN